MAVATGRKCARCGFPLDPAFRFCPGCSLATVGAEVLSTEIAARRHEAERRSRPALAVPRLVLLVGVATMVAFVAGLGILLFDRTVLERVLDVVTTDVPPDVQADRRSWEPDWRPVPAGTYIAGPGEDPCADLVWSDESFEISRFEVPNRLWQQFLLARSEELRDLGIWEDAVPRSDADWEKGADGRPRPMPGRLDHPVRDVIPLAVALFCEWMTERLGQPGVEIRPPTCSEWEYAARGSDGRTYPWGDRFTYLTPARTGSTDPRPPRNVNGVEPSPVTDVLDDTSVPFGVVAMGTNVSEMVISAAPQGDERLYDLLLTRMVYVWRAGASYAHSLRDAEICARTWDTRSRDFDARTRFVSVGIRLVKAPRHP